MNGETGGELSGTWTLYVSGAALPTLDEWKLTFTSQMTTGTDRRVVGTPSPYQPLPGKAVGPFPTASAIRPDQGIGPSPTIASDNTLGSFSEYQGRLYVAWVRTGGNGDIILATSDDGALTWSISGKINDDNGTIDGYAGLDGSPRTQLEPELAVDLTTGTLVATWLDARHDASNARVATYIATSINGGSTWSPQTYMNVPAAPTDAITQQPVDIGPIPGNQTASNAAKTVYNFGDRQGLTVWGGHVYAAFSANMNGGALDCVVAEAEIPAGPRIINSTMGPVSEWNDRLNPPTPDGPAVQAFEVQFDRLIDPNAFGPDDVTMIFRDEATPGSAPGTIIPIASVTPLDEGYYGPAQAHGATMFRIMLVDPQTAVGTYSYMVAAGISDRIRSLAERMVGGTTTVFQSTASMPLRPVPAPTLSHITVANIPAAETINDLTVTVSLDTPTPSDLTVTLISPGGTRIILAAGPFSAMPRFVDAYNRRNARNTVFSDDAAVSISAGVPPYTGIYRPAQSLTSRMFDTNPNGVWTLEIYDANGGNFGTLQTWSLAIEHGVNTLGIEAAPVRGNAMDQNGDTVTGQAAGQRVRGGRLRRAYADGQHLGHHSGLLRTAVHVGHAAVDRSRAAYCGSAVDGAGRPAVAGLQPGQYAEPVDPAGGAGRVGRPGEGHHDLPDHDRRCPSNGGREQPADPACVATHADVGPDREVDRAGRDVCALVEPGRVHGAGLLHHDVRRCFSDADQAGDGAV